MISGAPAEDSVFDRPWWRRVRYFTGWGAFAGAVGAAVVLPLSDVRTAGLADAHFLTKYGARPLLPALAMALAAPLVGAWTGVLAPLARWGRLGGVLLGVLGLLPLLAALSVVSAGEWRSPDQWPALAGLVLGAATTGYLAHLSYAEVARRRGAATNEAP